MALQKTQSHYIMIFVLYAATFFGRDEIYLRYFYVYVTRACHKR